MLKVFINGSLAGIRTPIARSMVLIVRIELTFLPVIGKSGVLPLDDKAVKWLSSPDSNQEHQPPEGCVLTIELLDNEKMAPTSGIKPLSKLP